MVKNMIRMVAATALVGLLAFGAGAQNRLQTSANSANFGVHSLRAGFTPDPKVINVTSGGDIDASGLGYGAGCVGFVTRRPDVVLNWTGSSSMLRFYVRGSGDTTLLINDGDGNWHCNDDLGGGNTNPQVDINNPPTGHYDIWIGSYRANEQIRGTLNITELSSNHG